MNPMIIQALRIVQKAITMKPPLALALLPMVMLIQVKTKAEVATVDVIGCGTGCRQDIRQLGPVSFTSYGLPRARISSTTVLQPGPTIPLLGRNRNGDPIVKFRGETYPKIEKFWVIADCKTKRVGLWAKESDGADAYWSKVFNEDGSANNCHSACGRSFDQWRLLCRAAGML